MVEESGSQSARSMSQEGNTISILRGGFGCREFTRECSLDQYLLRKQGWTKEGTGPHPGSVYAGPPELIPEPWGSDGPSKLSPH